MKKGLFLIVLLCAVLPAQADILIGLAGPMTGKEAAKGDMFRRGAEKAVESINRSGGVLGQKLKLLVMDDAGEPKQAVSVANELVARGAALVVGHDYSAASIAASDVYQDADIIEISPSSTNPRLTERGLSNVFRVCGRDDSQGPTAAAYLAEHFPKALIGIVHDKSSYGQGLADEFRKALQGRHLTEAMYQAVTPGEKDYSALVSRVRAAKLDFLYYAGYVTEAGLIVRQMRAQGLNTVLFGTDSLISEQYWAITGTDGDGTIMTFGPDPRLDPANKELVAQFRAEHFEPEAYTLYSYAAVQAWASAAAIAKSTERGKVAAALRESRHDTVLGKIGFDAKGDLIGPEFALYAWHQGRYAQLP